MGQIYVLLLSGQDFDTGLLKKSTVTVVGWLFKMIFALNSFELSRCWLCVWTNISIKQKSYMQHKTTHNHNHQSMFTITYFQLLNIKQNNNARVVSVVLACWPTYMSSWAYVNPDYTTSPLSTLNKTDAIDLKIQLLSTGHSFRKSLDFYCSTHCCVSRNIKCCVWMLYLHTDCVYSVPQQHIKEYFSLADNRFRLKSF